MSKLSASVLQERVVGEESVDYSTPLISMMSFKQDASAEVELTAENVTRLDDEDETGVVESADSGTFRLESSTKGKQMPSFTLPQHTTDTTVGTKLEEREPSATCGS